ncbi:MAG: phosphoadenylyl-sulfate reductase [Chloroflexi bacterium]|nr:phosphoadenylyl-sulfate reductase [Chloroflexota bacterium]
MGTTQTYTAEQFTEWNEALEGKTPQEILTWAVKEFQPGLTMACSFGGPSGMVLLDMISRIDPSVEVFYLDTDFLFPETYATRDKIIERYGIMPVAYKSKLTPEEQAKEHGDELWLNDPDLCCSIRKVEPNARALEGKRAWISGIRRDQGESRGDAPIVQWDEKFGLVKVLPLVGWLDADVWAYILKNDVPYNPLHDQSYPSIGCTHCTKAVKPGDDPRSGRWEGSDKTECGIHTGGDVIQIATVDARTSTRTK